MEERILGRSFEEMDVEEMQNVFGGTDENMEPKSTPVVTAVSGAALTFVGSYLVTAVFCKE